MCRKGKDNRKKRHYSFMLPNLCCNQLISTYIAAFVFAPSVLGEKFPTAEF